MERPEGQLEKQFDLVDQGTELTPVLILKVRSPITLQSQPPTEPGTSRRSFDESKDHLVICLF